MHVKVFFFITLEVKRLFVTCSCRGGMIQFVSVASRLGSQSSSFFPFSFFFPPGVVAVSDQRGPAADPQGLALGASGGGALCGAGGLLTQQVALHSSDRLLSVSFPCSET